VTNGYSEPLPDGLGAERREKAGNEGKEPMVTLRWALQWVDAALNQELQNRELRIVLNNLLLARDRELREWARAAIEARYAA
jgi:hypothetical protein